MDMDMDLDLNVALGLEEPPPNHNYRDYESKCSKSDIAGEEEWLNSLDAAKLEIEAIDVNEGLHQIERRSYINVDESDEDVPNENKDFPLKDEKNEVRGECEDVGDHENKEVPGKGEKNRGPSEEDLVDHDNKEVPVKEEKKGKRGECEDDHDNEEDVGDDDKKEVPIKEEKKGKRGEGEDDHDNEKVPVKEVKKEKNGEGEDELSGARVAATICRELEEKLKIGSDFPDLETVYLLYCEYARFKGFSVRKGEQRYFGRSTNIRWKEFICSATGLPNYRSVKHKLAVYKKLVTRSNCKGRLIVSRDDMGSFVVIMFEKDHSHELVTCDQTYLLRSSRHMSYAKKSLLEALNSSGVGVTTAYNFMVKESGGVQNVGFTKKDAYHHMERVRLQTKVEDGDAKRLYEYFTNKSKTDPFFFWKYQLDDDGRLMNIFFRDNRCAVDYDAFGDVLLVDTTYRTNKYNMICAPFVGINHHTRNVLFGMALMSDETTGSFKWLFEIFLQAMHGKQPKVIYTDQCRAMMNAIDVIFPNSKHRLCQWHISKNCASNFGKLNGNKRFKQLWYRCMNVVETDAEFKRIWKDMMENYEIENTNWYDGMFNLRERWASCYSRGIFTAGVLATSRSELTNKVLKDVVRSTVSLSLFVIQYEGILTNWRSTERAEDTYGIWRPGQAVPNSGLLLKAASVYTRNIYQVFEHELANCITLVVDPKTAIPLPNNNWEYTAKSRDDSSVERKVVFNSVTHVATCDCGKWETEGLICGHILRVFVIENVNDIPDCMIFRRWTKKAKDLKTLELESVTEESATMRHMTFANEFMRHMYEMVSSAMQYPALRARLVERMKEMDAEFRNIVSTHVASEPVEKHIPIVVPLFRNPCKIGARGFANVRGSKEANPFASKGRKRGPGQSSPAKKSKRKPRTNTNPTTINFMSTNEGDTREGSDPKFEDVEFTEPPLTL